MDTLDWFDKLKADFPNLRFRDKITATTTAHEHPRDALITLINNSMEMVKNPQHTVSKRGKTYKPVTCYKITGEDAEIALSYSRAALNLPNGKKVFVVPKADLSNMLAALKDAVSTKAFDHQLETIKVDRVAKLKGGGATKKRAA